MTTTDTVHEARTHVETCILNNLTAHNETREQAIRNIYQACAIVIADAIVDGDVVTEWYQERYKYLRQLADMD